MKEFDLENYSAMNLGLSMKFTSRSQACEVLWLQNNSINNHLLHLLVNYFVNNKQKISDDTHTCTNLERKGISKIIQNKFNGPMRVHVGFSRCFFQLIIIVFLLADFRLKNHPLLSFQLKSFLRLG